MSALSGQMLVGDRELKVLIEPSDKQPGTVLGIATGGESNGKGLFQPVLFLLENAVW